jgi:threonine dehydratase
VTATPTIADIRAAAERVAGIARRTPVIEWDGAAAGTSGQTWLKLESLQPTGAFKVRGAANHLKVVAGRVPGVITASSGNHGQAVAYVARRLGIPAVVVVPETVNPVKARAITEHGAELVRCGRTMDDRYARAQEIVRERGWHFVPSYDDPLIVAGQGTCGLEIVEQCPNLAAVVVPVGGGGLASGVALAVKTLRPGIRVIGAEPAALPRYAASRAAGRPVTVPFADTVADGLRGQRPGAITWEIAKDAVDEFVAVPDDAIMSAVRGLCLEAHVIAEPSGAVPAAAILSGLVPDRPVLAVVSGGNIDPAQLIEILRRPTS